MERGGERAPPLTEKQPPKFLERGPKGSKKHPHRGGEEVFHRAGRSRAGERTERGRGVRTRGPTEEDGRMLEAARGDRPMATDGPPRTVGYATVEGVRKVVATVVSIQKAIRARSGSPRTRGDSPAR